LWAVDDCGVARQGDVVKQNPELLFGALLSLELVSKVDFSFADRNRKNSRRISNVVWPAQSTDLVATRDFAASQRWALAFWRRDTRPATHTLSVDRGLETKEKLTRKIREPASPST
jgi:hypothetical protein